MPLLPLAFLLTGASVALSLAIAIVLLRDGSVDPLLRWTSIALVGAGAAYSLVGGPAMGLVPAALAMPLRAMAACGVVLLWSIVQLLFEPRYTSRPAVLWPMGLTALAFVAPIVAAAAWPQARLAAQLLVTVAALALVAHMLWTLLAGRRDDLDPHRRRLRLLLAGGGSLYVAAVLVSYLVGLREGRPLEASLWSAGGQVAFKLAWVVLTAGSPSPLSRLYTTTHSPEPLPEAVLAVAEWESASLDLQGRTDTATVGSGADSHSVNRALTARQARQILGVMEAERLYRRPGLTIGDLARQLNLPEHRVRAVINGHLGFKNYSAFLNHFRLREVARRLREPEDAHLPILSIALDAGYASIGPFNRAFRDAHGMTPTDYRRAGAADPLADNAA